MIYYIGKVFKCEICLNKSVLVDILLTGGIVIYKKPNIWELNYYTLGFGKGIPLSRFKE